MARAPYRKVSRESAIITRVLKSADRIVERAVHDNPIPIGEERIDPRTARRRLAMVPEDELYDHLSQHG